MTKKEAEENIRNKDLQGGIITFHGDVRNFNLDKEIGRAEGFLEGLNSPEALQRPEVLELVKALEKCIGWIEPVLDGFRIDPKAQSRTDILLKSKQIIVKFKEVAKL